MSIQQIVNSLLQNNPNIKNNPNAQEMLNVIMSNDSVKGEQIARNLCQTYGLTKEEAVQKARQFFNI